MIQLQVAKEILKHRYIAQKMDSMELQQKREKWLDKLNLLNWNGNFRVLEMYQTPYGVFKGRPEKYQFFNKNHNTRTKILSETCCEVDKLPIKKSIPFMCEIMSSLIRNKIHFAVFYAQGQRSPHIRIYDFEELNDLNPMQRIKAQILFWREHVPFGCFQYVDTGMFVDEHPMQIEFSIHYRHKTPFNLMFEYPFEEVKNE